MTGDRRVVVVTGGASGIGAEIVRRFAALDDTVVIADRDAAGATRLAASLPHAVAYAVDVTAPDEIEGLIEKTAADRGRLDVLVNCAGAAQRPSPMTEVLEADFESEVALNLRAAYLASSRAADVMGAGGVIVNIGSMGGRRPRPMSTVYNSSKGGIIAFTQEFAKHVAPRIRVYAVNPTGVETPFLLKALGPAGLTDEHRARLVAGIPMGRLATPADVAAAVVFLADPASGLRSGEFIDVDGGRSIQ